MKNVWKGFQIAIGGGLATALGWTLLLLLSPLKRWLFRQEDNLSPSGRTMLSIFLAVLCLILLGLLIWSQTAYSNFRKRVYENKITEQDFMVEAFSEAAHKARKLLDSPKAGRWKLLWNLWRSR